MIVIIYFISLISSPLKSFNILFVFSKLQSLYSLYLYCYIYNFVICNFLHPHKQKSLFKSQSLENKINYTLIPDSPDAPLAPDAPAIPGIPICPGDPGKPPSPNTPLAPRSPCSPEVPSRPDSP